MRSQKQLEALPYPMAIYVAHRWSCLLPCMKMMAATAHPGTFVYGSCSRQMRLSLGASRLASQGRCRAGWCVSFSSAGFPFPRRSCAYSRLKSTQGRRLRCLERSAQAHARQTATISRTIAILGVTGLCICTPVPCLRRGCAAVRSGTG